MTCRTSPARAIKSYQATLLLYLQFKEPLAFMRVCLTGAIGWIATNRCAKEAVAVCYG